MGTFDYLVVDTDQLPVTEAEKEIIGESHRWQTKDFDCTFTEIDIDKIQHHGYVNFYSEIAGEFYEFYAKFTDGELVVIEGGGGEKQNNIY